MFCHARLVHPDQLFSTEDIFCVNDNHPHKILHSFDNQGPVVQCMIRIPSRFTTNLHCACADKYVLPPFCPLVGHALREEHSFATVIAVFEKRVSRNVLYWSTSGYVSLCSESSLHPYNRERKLFG